MTRRRARMLSILSVTVMAFTLTGCGAPEQTTTQRLTRVLDQTSLSSHRFDLRLQDSRGTFRVTGLIEDDARYQAALTVDGARVLDEVVRDDAVADRAFGPVAVRLLQRAGPHGKVSVGEPRAQLLAGHWVLDPVGAPDLLSLDPAQAQSGTVDNEGDGQLGEDPVLNAVTILGYVRAVLAQQDFKPFNKHDLSYDPDTDPFPVPSAGSGLTRYDAIPVDLPSAADIQGLSGRAELPGTESFRRMALYVDRQGRVVDVREEIDIASRVPDLLDNAGLDLPANIPSDQVAATVLQVLNDLRTRQGEAPIDVHTLDVHLSEFDAPLQVALPNRPVRGSLAFLIDRGRTAEQQASG